ncbi:MAG: hypothetical protein LUD72_10265 [Bacteroidales bacterium]|nr:hypothetical protein [Bacteroidales bacterium]
MKAKEQVFNTLLIDGSNVLYYCLYGSRTTRYDGVPMGGVFQFLLQIKILLQKYNFRFVYVMWDGDSSGQLRHDLCPDYKSNRDKGYEESNQSDYMRAVNAKIRDLQNYLYNNRRTKDHDDFKNKRKELFFIQRNVLIELLDELYIRQCLCDYTEADDLIGYYVSHKLPEERIVILSNDRDLTQLIGDRVIIYAQSMRRFLTKKTATEVLRYHYSNVKTMKILCGDPSDNIKGITGVGEATLVKYIPRLKTESVTVDEVREEARKLNEGRKEGSRYAPLKWAQNIVNAVTVGCQGDKIYEINERLIDLTDPLMPEEAKETLESMMHAPMDSEGRSMENVYKLIDKYDVDMLRAENTFASFFREFAELINKEKKNLSFFA